MKRRPKEPNAPRQAKPFNQSTALHEGELMVVWCGGAELE